MKRPFTRLEKKQLLIFALIAFGIPYLMGIPMAFGYQRGTSLDFFANAQMYYPAAGAIVVFLLTKTEFPMPRRFFYGYLVLTVLFAISSVLSVRYTGCQPVGYGHQYASQLPAIWLSGFLFLLEQQ